MRLLVMGAGGHAREVLDVVETVLGRDTALARTVLFAEPGMTSQDAADLVHARGYALVPAIPRDVTHYVAAVGLPQLRRRLSRIAEDRGLEPASAVSPLSFVPTASFSARGLVCFAGTYVSTNVTIGEHCHLNQRCSVSHDVRIGDFVTLSPGVVLTGRTVVEDDVFVGAGAVLSPDVHVGRGAVIGAGAVVVRSVTAGSTVVGNPARPLEDR